MGDQVDLWVADKHQSFVQVGAITFSDVARHTQSTQNNTFAKSLKYFKKEVRDKHGFLQPDSIIFAAHGLAYPKYPKWKVCNIFAISSKKKEGMKLIFCMQINIKLLRKLILLILVGMTRHAQITQNNKFVKSLWYSKILHFGPKLDQWPFPHIVWSQCQAFSSLD